MDVAGDKSLFLEDYIWLLRSQNNKTTDDPGYLMNLLGIVCRFIINRLALFKGL